MKIVSYNVNGIRAALTKGFAEWLANSDIDIICLQEIKCKEEQLDTTIFTNIGYHSYWYPAEKPGYSGTAILTKLLPKNVIKGCGIELYDNEGRIIVAEYEHFAVMSVYMPSGASGEARQGIKIQFLEDFQKYIAVQKIQSPALFVAGDYNIAHTEIDIHNPKANVKSSGFLVEERNWLSDFFSSGYVDTFRMFHKEPHQYSWWNYRTAARPKNQGWRIDYISADSSLSDTITDAGILADVVHSDHCPIYVTMKL